MLASRRATTVAGLKERSHLIDAVLCRRYWEVIVNTEQGRIIKVSMGFCELRALGKNYQEAKEMRLLP